MKIEIREQKKNPLFKREEVRFEINHAGEETPTRNAVAEEIAKIFKAKRSSVVIDEMKGRYGIGVSDGYAKVYDSKEAALEFENEHLLARNGIAKEEYAPEAAEGSEE
ncbi:MAG: 30S ribosomal protein S24e [Candidatus Methanomethylophilaceae archaeon]|jgi:small subunit ribosomal protein S24e